MQVNTELYLFLVFLLIGAVIVLSYLSHSIMDRLVQGNIFSVATPSSHLTLNLFLLLDDPLATSK